MECADDGGVDFSAVEGEGEDWRGELLVEYTRKGKGDVKCAVFVLSDSLQLMPNLKAAGERWHSQNLDLHT